MRGGVSFKGIGVQTATVKLKTGIVAADEGKAVTLTADSEVGIGTTGDVLVGKLIKVEGDGFGTIECKGFLQVPYKTGVVPTVGAEVVVDGEGHVKDVAALAINEGGAANLSYTHKGRGTVIALDTTNLIATVLI